MVASEISLTVPYRCEGMDLYDLSLESFFDNRSTPSVSAIGPGAITFDVMPLGPCSIATAMAMASTPAFATET